MNLGWWVSQNMLKNCLLSYLINIGSISETQSISFTEFYAKFQKTLDEH